MNIVTNGGSLCVSDVGDLCALGAESFRNQVVPAIQARPCAVEIDMSRTEIVDSAGIAVLLAVFKVANKHDLRIVNPTLGVRQMLERVNLHRCFDYVYR